MARRVTIDNLAEEINKILDEYSDGIADGMDIATRKVAQLGARVINASASGKFKGRYYSKSWTQQTTKYRLGSQGVIYSRLQGLPHLLEYGHANRGGGRTPGREHIAPAEREIIAAFEREVTNSIEKN